MTTTISFAIVNGQNPKYLDRFDGDLTIEIPYTTTNRSSSILYYQLVSGSASYSITFPANGKFTVANATTTSAFFTATRVNPGVDLTENVDFTLSVYTGSNYTGLIGSQVVTQTFIVKDLTAYTYQSLTDFSTGTVNWSGQTGTTALLSTTGLASLYNTTTYTGGTGSYSMSASLTRSNLVLPNYSKIILSYFTINSGYNSTINLTTTFSDYGNDVRVNANLIASEQTATSYQTFTNTSTTTFAYASRWIEHTVDLSAYAGQTITLNINTYSFVSFSGSANIVFKVNLDGFRISASN